MSRIRSLVAGLAFTLLAGGGTVVFADTYLGLPVGRLIGQAPERLLPVVPSRHVGGSYRFVRTQPGSSQPVAFNPCRPVEVVYNPYLAPEGTDALVTESLAELSRRTGLVLRVSGTTDERPRTERSASDFARYGRGWSPVLLAWSTPAETPGLAGPVVGLGGSVARGPRLSQHLTYVSGSVTLDASDLGAAMRSPDGPRKVRAILLHELGHLVGLDHVDDPGELMHSENRGQVTFGPGDLEGLATLGAGACRT